MNLNQLYYFITLAQTEHYTKAAKMLSITQPTLSHAIASLEEELGTRLFGKKGRNVGLTKYGKVFYEYAAESVQVLENGIKKTKAMNSETGGRIDLGYIYTLGTEFIPNLADGFLKEHPELDIQFQFTVGNTQDILNGLKEERFDLAFCSRKEKENQVLFLPVAEERLVTVVSKDHPLAVFDEIELTRMADYPQIFFTKSSGVRPTIERLFEKAGIVPKIAYEVEEDGAMAGLAARNFGIAVMPEVPILKYLDVKVINIKSPVTKRYIYMAWMKDKYQPPVVKKFAEYAKKISGPSHFQ